MSRVVSSTPTVVSIGYEDDDVEDEQNLCATRCRNYCIVGCGFATVLGMFVLLVVLATLVFAKALPPVQTNKITLLVTNDVYKVVSKPDALRAFVWKSPDLRDATQRNEFDAFLEHCRGDNEQNCFPAAADVLKSQGFAEKDLLDVEWMQMKHGCENKKVYNMLSNKTDGYKALLFGGLKAFGATIRSMSQAMANVYDSALVMHAGDFIAPSYTANMYKGEQWVQMMNHAGFDIVGFGNHDFDFGANRLLQLMSNSTFLWLGANVKRKADGKLFGVDTKGYGLVKATNSCLTPKQTEEMAKTNKTNKTELELYPTSYWLGRGIDGNSSNVPPTGVGVVKRRLWNTSKWSQGKLMCVFGITGQRAGQESANKDKSFNGKSPIEITDDVEEGLAILRELHNPREAKDKCDLIIAVTHTRTGRDLNFWNRAVRSNLHIDAIIGGHDHYTVFMDLKFRDKHTYFIKTGSDGHILGQLQFKLNMDEPLGEGAPKEASMMWVPVVEGSCDNPCEERRFKEAGTSSEGGGWAECVEWMDWATQLQDVFARNATELAKKSLGLNFSGIYDTENARIHETRAINLWTDLCRVAFNADASLLFGGGIRQEAYTEYPAGNQLTQLDVHEEFPFERDRLVAVSIPAAAVVPVVERAMHVGCKALVDTDKLFFSGLEMDIKKSDSSGSGCELVNVTFFGGAHIEGIKDLRKERWNQNATLEPGSILYQNGATQNEGSVLRFVVPSFFLAHSASVAYDVFQAAVDVASQQRICLTSADSTMCSDGKPSSGFWHNISKRQADFDTYTSARMKTPRYIWGEHTPLLVESVELPMIDALQQGLRLEPVQRWAVDRDAEASENFWAERHVAFSEVSPARGTAENLPIARVRPVMWMPGHEDQQLASDRLAAAGLATSSAARSGDDAPVVDGVGVAAAADVHAGDATATGGSVAGSAAAVGEQVLLGERPYVVGFLSRARSLANKVSHYFGMFTTSPHETTAPVVAPLVPRGSGVLPVGAGSPDVADPAAYGGGDARWRLYVEALRRDRLSAIRESSATGAPAAGGLHNYFSAGVGRSMR